MTRKRVTGLKPIFHQRNLFARSAKTNIANLIGQQQKIRREKVGSGPTLFTVHTNKFT